MHTWRSVYVHVEHHVDTRVRAQVECDDGTFTVYTAGFETGRNVSTRAGSTVAVCAHFRACVRLLCHMFSLVSREKATQVACSAASAAAARSADTPRGLLRAPGTSAPGGGQTAYTKRGVGF